MLEDNPMLRRRGDAPAVRAVGDSPPSSVAQARLADALRNRAQAYQQGAAVDLTIMEALLRLDHPEAAAQALEDHRAALQAMARDLQVAVADAAVEREAERVCSAVATVAPPRPLVSSLRRRVLAVTGAAAVVVALVLPTARFAPRTTLTSVDGSSALDDVAAARERLEAARTWARALRENTTTKVSEARAATPSRASGEMVRDRVRTILAADAPGGSAAPTVSKPADVIDLEARRAKRATAPAPAKRRDPAPPDPTPPHDPDPAPVPLPEVGVDLSPDGSVPLGAGAAVDLDAAAGDLDAAAGDLDDVAAAPDTTDF